jgi:hypothetical protein
MCEQESDISEQRPEVGNWERDGKGKASMGLERP